MNEDAKLAAALAYADKGITVFPVHSVRDGRCTCGKARCTDAGKHPRITGNLNAATTDKAQIRAWWRQWPDANIGAAMARSHLVATDVDPRNGGAESWAALTEAAQEPLTQTWTNLTSRGGAHYIYRAPDGFEYHGDALAPGVDVKWDGYVILPPSVHETGAVYAWEIGYGPDDCEPAPLPAALIERMRRGANGVASFAEKTPIAELLRTRCPDGVRGTTLASIAGYLRNEVPVDVAMSIAQAWNTAYCEPPMEAYRVAECVAGMYRRYTEPPRVRINANGATETAARPAARANWPAPLAEAALYGLVGRLLAAAEPCTEADPAAVALTFLVMAGNVFGRGPYVQFGTEVQRCNLFVGLVGATGSGRKGTSVGPARTIVGGADASWAAHRIGNGLVSGEGVIWNVRDAVTGETGSGAEGFQVRAPKTGDGGVTDKRWFVIEPELGGLLTAMHRSGSTLSHVLRAAWDGGKLQSASKNQPVSATGAHISVVGHITPEELRTALTSADVANGFGNRLLWALVRQSKRLSLPPAFAGPVVDDLIREMREVLDHATGCGLMGLGVEAREAYDGWYHALPDDPPGLSGVMAVRVPAFVLRLAMVYALLDLSGVVRLVHLEAAWAVVRFCMDSAAAIFGEMTGDPFADRIYEALLVGPLSRHQISDDVFSRHAPAAAIARALQTLERAGLAYATRQVTAGRPMEVWSAW